MNRSRKKTQGLALLEILIAIGILGLIAAGVASLASRTFEEQNANTINQNVTDMALSIQKAFKRQGEYASSTTNSIKELVDARVVAEQSSNNPVTNAVYDYEQASRTVATKKDAFLIGIDGLSPSLCTTLVTGSLLDDANYLSVVAAGASATNATLFNVDADWDGASATGVVKSAKGTNASILDPVKAASVCDSASSKILVGFY